MGWPKWFTDFLPDTWGELLLTAFLRFPVSSPNLRIWLVLSSFHHTWGEDCGLWEDLSSQHLSCNRALITGKANDFNAQQGRSFFLQRETFFFSPYFPSPFLFLLFFYFSRIDKLTNLSFRNVDSPHLSPIFGIFALRVQVRWCRHNMNHWTFFQMDLKSPYRFL